MKKKVTLSIPSFLAVVLATSIILSIIFEGLADVSSKVDSDDYAELKLITDVLGLVRKNYVEEVNFKKLSEGATKGILQILDPHSTYLTPESFKELQADTKGEFGGLGIEITVKDGVLTVVAPIEDTPATRAGLKAGDQIVKISNEFTRDMTVTDAVKKMRGPKGSTVVLHIHRKGRREIMPVTLVRDIIKVQSIRYRLLETGFGYIRLNQFQDESAGDFAKALSELKKQNNGELKGLVFDMRNNPGGLLNEATRISDMFLKDGLLVYTDGRLETQKQKFYAHDGGDEPNFRLIILMNGGSASASEIVAGALQDSGRALILGTQSFGKGSVQSVLPVENGGALKLTTALYYTRNGRSIQAQGISPDITVEEPKLDNQKDEDDVFSIKEKDLPGAFHNPKDDKKEGEVIPENTEIKIEKNGPVIIKNDVKLDEKDKESRILIGSREAMSADLQQVLKFDPQLKESIDILKKWSNDAGKTAPEFKKVLEERAAALVTKTEAPK